MKEEEFRARKEYLRRHGASGSDPIPWIADDWDDEPDNCYKDDEGEWHRVKRTKMASVAMRIASHITVMDMPSALLLADSTWALFQLVDEYLDEGGQSYSSVRDMANSAYCIKATYDGPLPNINNFDIDKCYCLAAFNNKFGLKLTAGAKNIFHPGGKMKTNAAYDKLMCDAMNDGWCEANGKGEEYMNRRGVAVIDPRIIRDKVYPDRNVVIEPDGKHYTRDLTGIGRKTKIAYGNGLRA
jgi:hypothetical protein